MYIDMLTKSVTFMIEELEKQKKMLDYPIEEDKRMEERIERESDSL